MAGYIRQDTTNNIADGNVINASDFDNEYNAIEAAFHATTGHTHDGTSAEGAPITKIGPTQDVVASATALTPKTDNTVDLGSSTLEYKDLFIDGTANIDSLVADTADINAGTIDGVTIGGASAGAATFTTVGATTGNITTVNATTLDATNVEVTNIKAKDGTTSMTLADTTGVASFSANPVLSSGTANGVLYLNGSKVATSGSALTFDGTTLSALTSGTSVYFSGGDSSVGRRLQLYATSTTNTGDTQNINALGATGVLAFALNTSEQMRLTSTGLGIGTSSPVAKLDVNGNQSFGSTTYIIGYGLNSQTGTIAGATSPFYGLNMATFTGFSGGGIGLHGYYGLLFSTAGTEQMRLDTSGNLGLGVTPSAWTIRGLQVASSSVANDGNDTYLTANGYFDGSWKYINSDFAAQYYQVNGVHAWRIAPSGTAGNAISFTQAMTLTSGGDLLVGTTSGTFINGKGIVIADATAARLKLADTDAGVGVSNGLELGFGGATGSIYNLENGALLFGTNNTERARITSGGDLLVGTTTSYGSRKFEVRGGATATFLSTFGNTNSDPLGVQIYYDGYDPNGTGNEFLNCNGGGTVRATIRSNGGIANYQANNVNLSDRREKTNFAPAKSYLDTICAIPVQTFNYIDQSEDDPGLTLGVVAQDVQAVAPELVMESNWGTEDDPKMRLSIYQTDLQYALMKCIQEQQALITDLRARVAALESQP